MSQKGKPVDNETAEALAQSLIKRFKDTKAKGFFAVMTEDAGMRWGFVDMGHGECLDRLNDMHAACFNAMPKNASERPGF